MIFPINVAANFTPNHFAYFSVQVSKSAESKATAQLPEVMDSVKHTSCDCVIINGLSFSQLH
jgi:hypothetical protein